MNPLRLFKDVLLSLHGGGQPRHLAAGFAVGAALGLVPKGNLFAVAFFLLFFLLNVDKGMALLTAGLFTGIGYGLDGLAHKIGLALLRSPALRGFWTALYDLPIVPLTRFNNTVVLGNVILGALLYLPLYFGFLKALALYDSHARARVESLPIVKTFKGFDLFEKYKRWLS